MPDHEPVTFEELKKHTKKGDLYVLLHDNGVYRMIPSHVMYLTPLMQSTT